MISKQTTAALLWVSSLQFILMEFIISATWTIPYSFNKNYISDLGAKYRGEFPPGSGSLVDSPQHVFMNASFILFGITCALGALLLRRSMRNAPYKILLNAITTCLVLTGIGVMLIGAFPEDVNLYGHLSGAVLQVLGSNTAFVLAGVWLLKSGHPATGAISIIAGIFSLCAFLVTGYVGFKGPLLGLYAGAWERMSVWTMIAWLSITGIFLVVKNIPRG